VLSQHVDELQPYRIAERLRHPRQPDGGVAPDVGVDERLAAGLSGWSLLLGGELQLDCRHYIDFYRFKW
jgi:hypothetical protein